MSILVIDIGGSSIKYGYCDKDGNLRSLPSQPVGTSFSDFIAQIESVLPLGQAEGIGISCPGAVDTKTGYVQGISAVPWIHGPSFIQELSVRFHLPVTIENDANCAALSELWLGSAADLSNCIFVIFGTGIGGAIIRKRTIVRGNTNQAGEFGLMIMDHDQTSGKYHVWSHYSTNHTVRNAEKECGLEEGSLNGITLFDEASSNPVYEKHVNRFYEAAANGILNLHSIFDPEAIILGGGISRRPGLKEEILARIEARASVYPGLIPVPELRICKFGNDANLIGAAYHYFRSTT